MEKKTEHETDRLLHAHATSWEYVISVCMYIYIYMYIYNARIMAIQAEKIMGNEMGALILFWYVPSFAFASAVE